MIRIYRATCPACLADSPPDGDHYRRKEVVLTLWTMQHDKCCYSESKLPNHGHGKAVEHWRPQSIFRWKRNEWTNLLLVCPQCNGRKSNRFPVTLRREDGEVNIVYLTNDSDARPAILDPSNPEVDPEAHLTYVLDDCDPLYGQVIPRGSSVLGRETIDITGIGDEFFLRRRKSRLIDVLAEAWLNILRAENDRNTDARDEAIARFEQYVLPTAEYAGLAREYSKRKKMDERFGMRIPGLYSVPLEEN